MSFAVEGLLLLMCTWCSYTDLKERRIPNVWTYTAFLVLLVYRMFDPVFLWGLIPAVVLLGCWFFIPPSLSIGEGDIKLLAVIGLGIGFNQTMVVFFYMGLGWLISKIAYRIVKRRKLNFLPLAPFILIGLILAIILKYAI